MLKPAKQVRGLGKAGLLPSRGRKAASPNVSQEGPAVAANACHPDSSNFVPTGSRVLPQAQPAIAQEDTAGTDVAEIAVNDNQARIAADAFLSDQAPASSGQSAGGILGPSTATGTAAAPHKDSENEAQGQIKLAARTPFNQLGSRPARRKRPSTVPAAQSDETTPGNNAKRARRAKSRSSSTTPTEVLSDLIGQVVEVPGAIFYVKTPGVFYIGDIIKPEAKHKNAVEVVFRDDESRYWFPAKDVRKWLKEQREREADLARCTTEPPNVLPTVLPAYDDGVPAPSEAPEAAAAAPAVGGVDLEEERLAAQALTDISAGISGGSGGPTYSDTAANVGRAGLGKETKGTSRLRNMSN